MSAASSGELPEWERRLLGHLAIFFAGFTLDAATAVADANSTGSTIDEGIANLVAKSLVTSDGSAPSSRWRLLETIRVYALEKLAESGEEGLAAFFRDFVAPAVVGSGSLTSIQEIVRYSRELDNVFAAVDWSFSAVGDSAIGIELAVAFVPVWSHRSMLDECHRRIEQALRVVHSQSKSNARHQMQLHSALGSTLMLTRGTGPETNGRPPRRSPSSRTLQRNPTLTFGPSINPHHRPSTLLRALEGLAFLEQRKATVRAF